MKTKTVKQWLETLPKPLRKEALKDAKYLKENLKANNLTTAILYSFLWQGNEAKHYFWDSFYNALYWANSFDKEVKRKSIFNP
jgi:hypothetical protein